MIRTDHMHQWAPTQMSTPEQAKWPLEDGRKQNGLDYQGRYPEAAHAAIDWDDNDPRPIPGCGLVLWLVWGVAAVFGALTALHFCARMGWL